LQHGHNKREKRINVSGRAARAAAGREPGRQNAAAAVLGGDLWPDMQDVRGACNSIRGRAAACVSALVWWFYRAELFARQTLVGSAIHALAEHSYSAYSRARLSRFFSRKLDNLSMFLRSSSRFPPQY